MKYLVLLLLIASSIIFGCNDTGNQDNSDQVENTSTSNDTDTPEKIHYIDPKAQLSSKVIAKVNGIPIYETELDYKSLQSLITDEILFQYGIAQGVAKGIQLRARHYKQTLIIRELMHQITEDLPPSKEISDEEIEEYYNENKGKSPVTKMQEIIFSDSNIGNEIRKRAQSGEDFKTIADSYKQKGTNVQSRDLGYNIKYLDRFENKEVGALSDIIEKDGGAFSLVMIVEVKVIPLDKARSSIRHLLNAQRNRDLVDESARQLAAENNINIEIIEDSK